jgi:hypothetical protein
MKYYNLCLPDNLAGGTMLDHIEGLSQYAEREVQLNELAQIIKSRDDANVIVPIYLDGNLLPIIWSTETLVFVNEDVKSIICSIQTDGVEFLPIKIHRNDTINYFAIFPQLVLDCIDYEKSVGRKRMTRSGPVVECSYIIFDETKIPDLVYFFRLSVARNLYFVSEKLMNLIRDFSGHNKSGAIFTDYNEGFSFR